MSAIIGGMLVDEPLNRRRSFMSVRHFTPGEHC